MTTGALVVVGTPIGNLGDLSPRAVEILADVDAIACEDTRRTGRLLVAAGIDRPRLLVVNDHTEPAMIGGLVERVVAGERIALVSDAGMPTISDPGERLVAAVVDAGGDVEVVPGPSAAVSALVVSGLPTGRFVFEGFLSRRSSARRRRLELLRDEPRTIVVYEAPHRMAQLLRELVEHFGGDRRLAVARELTKLHEEVWRGSAAEAIGWLAPEPRGEFVVVIDGAPAPPAASEDEIAAALRDALALGTSKRDAAAEVARTLGVSKRDTYAMVNEL